MANSSRQADLCLSRPMVVQSLADLSNSPTFSLASYNILADCHVRPEEYSYTQPQHLSQDFRHRRLMEEVRHLDADIVCLQEVGPDYFNQRLLPDMQRLGYEGVMAKRKIQDEGEATLYRPARFEHLHTKPVYFADFASRVMGAGQMEPMVRKAAELYLDRPDLELVSQLQCRQTGRVVTIGNVHVIWNQMLTPDVQTAQAACAVGAVLETAGGQDMPMVVCGDFNSEPSMPPYQLACQGQLKDSSITELQKLLNLFLPDGKTMSLYEAVNAVPGLLDHTASLSSAYKAVLGREPKVTCYGSPFLTNEVLDYILFGTKALRCLGVLQEPEWLQLKASSGGLPDTIFPSDHISQKAVFAFA